MARKRDRWKRHQSRLDPRRLVFIDETWAKTNMTRTHGRARRGERLVAKAPHGRWRTLTFLAALRHDRIDAQKKPAIVAAMHWPKSACAVGRAGDEMGARMARSRLRLAVRALLKMRKARRRLRRRTLPAHR